MSSFRDQSWEHRLQGMGDEAEAVFEEVWPTGWARYGLNRPPIQVHKLPIKLRYTPDYITTHCLVEVQGVGRDQTLKVKLEKHLALQAWSQEMQLRFFIWDNVGKRWCAPPWMDLHEALYYAPVREFPEGKQYYALDLAEIRPQEWVCL